METTTNAPICKTQICKRPMTHLKESNCWRCLVCNPIPKGPVVTEQPESKYVDVKPDEKRVREMIASSMAGIREMIQEEMANWNIQRPPITKKEIENTTNNVHVEPKVEDENWRAKAKRLGISLHKTPRGTGMRTKANVLTEIKVKEENESAKANEFTDETTHP